MREAMTRLVERFLDRAREDPGLADFAARSDDVTLHFALPDLDLQMHLGFAEGAVVAGLGPPADGDGVVQLKMPADLFDGMLTGRRNAMQAAMNGELSFSGDTAKAMTLQQINPDMSRLYRAAREEIGDPGDLTSLPAAGGPAAPGARSPAPSDDDERHELCRIVDELYTAQLITATGGNVSVRRRGHDDQAWITPSQLFKGDLAPEILVRIGMDGKALDEGARSPSSEALMHTAVLAAKPEAQAVIHCHAPNATVLVNSGLPFLPISTEAAFFQNLGRIPFVMPGTQALADAIVEAMAEGWAVLMQNHGLLVAGRTLRRAADMAEIIERSCEVILGCHAVGREPPVLPEDVVEMLGKYGDLMA
jgi:autoinducer 2 (AI-2) kinase